MATAANPPPGAIPTNDPFVSSSGLNQRYATFDTDQFSLLSTSSPSQAKRALEAHLQDTDRRIQDASRLGTTLVQQRKDLAARLSDVESVQQDSDVPADLKKKLVDLEKEYNEVGKESARAFLPKPRSISQEVAQAPSTLTGTGRESPTKATAPSRRQRNQPSNRIHDIEFATEISTQLLAQVRQLQAMLAEKDETVRETSSAKAHLEAETEALTQHIKHMGEIEQRYKDENWNLETKLQELEGNFKSSSDKEARLTSVLKATESEKTTAQRELDELKASHEKLKDEHAVIKRVQEADLNALRRDSNSHVFEKERLQKRIAELTSQNIDLAKAVSYRQQQPGAATDTDFVSADEDHQTSDGTPDNSEPASPVKGTPRHGMLESETLKSSLNHAHRTIQNLKNNIHREKTEKIELKRMLQDARDEVESRRSDGGIGANMARKRRSELESSKPRRTIKPGSMSAARNSSTEILENDSDWEEHDGAGTPSKSRGGSSFLPARGTTPDADTTEAFDTANEREGATTDAFETGRESLDDGDYSDELTETESQLKRDGTSRGVSSHVSSKPGDRRSFMSTASTSAGEDDDSTVRTPLSQSQTSKYHLRMGSHLDSRRSLRAREISSESPSRGSPASSVGTPRNSGQTLGDELDALDEESFEGTPVSQRRDSSPDGTPATRKHDPREPATPSSNSQAPPEQHTPLGSERSSSTLAPSAISSLRTPSSGAAANSNQGIESALGTRTTSALRDAVAPKPQYVDAGVMTDPWDPQSTPVTQSSSLRQRAGEAVGGALAGFGLGRLKSKDSSGPTESIRPDSEVMGNRSAYLPEDADELSDSDQRPTSVLHSPPAISRQSQILSQQTQPTNASASPENRDMSTPAQSNAASQPPAREDAPPIAETLGFSTVVSQEIEPIEPPSYFPQEVDHDSLTAPLPSLPTRGSRGVETMYDGDVAHTDPEAKPEVRDAGTDAPPAAMSIPGTDNARPGAGFFAAPLQPPADPSRSVGSDAQTAAPPRPRMIDGGSQTAPGAGFFAAPLQPPTDPSRSVGSDAQTAAAPRPRMVDGGSQTVMSSDDIERMLRDKSAATVLPARSAGSDAASVSRPTVITTNFPRQWTNDSVANEAVPTKYPRRPTSAGSIRAKLAAQPPLPKDHTEKIAAAQRIPSSSSQAAAGAMGPPLMPASAYKFGRPTTPAEQSRLSKDGTTPRPPRGARSAVQSPSGLSKRTSMSSFVSECDERFQIQRSQFMYPDDVTPTTDPRMIQAITQTMIGEYMWKYTRKAGRSENSRNRHRRFVWIHPYTRTLYWSEKDPSSAGRDMLKAKSVAIQAVRVMTDDNAYPPGLHRKSLVVVTPGREIIFTAPTSQRHETWFNSLSYLLLRTESENREAEDTVDQADLDEFNPGLGSSFRQSISRVTGRSQSRVSLSSYNSRTTRNSSPGRHAGGTHAQRQAAASSRAGTMPPTLTPQMAGTSNSRTSKTFSSMSGKLRPGSASRGSMPSGRGRSSTLSAWGRSSGMGGGPEEIYEASVIAGSAEDVRAQMAEQAEAADRLENVRACCDGQSECHLCLAELHH